MVPINSQDRLVYAKNNVESINKKIPLGSIISSKTLNSPAEFPGGIKELASYLSKNIRYPRNSRNSSTRGRVIICFKVEKDGKITNVDIVKGVNKILNKEAKRVVTNMPNWKPALQNGIAVSSVLNIPIVFFRN